MGQKVVKLRLPYGSSTVLEVNTTWNEPAASILPLKLLGCCCIYICLWICLTK